MFFPQCTYYNFPGEFTAQIILIVFLSVASGAVASSLLFSFRGIFYCENNVSLHMQCDWRKWVWWAYASASLFCLPLFNWKVVAFALLPARQRTEFAAVFAFNLIAF